MPSDHARIRRNIWADTDWRRLSVGEQWLYLHLLSSPTLSLCGVADWRPARIAKMAAGTSADDVVTFSAGLIDKEFVLPDFEAEEIAIRSWVKHDGLMRSPNVAKALRSAWDGTASEPIRGLIVGQLRRLYDNDPTLAGWDHIGDLLDKGSLTFAEALSEVMPGSSIEGSDEVPETLRERVPEGVPESVPMGFAGSSIKGSGNRASLLTPNSLLLTPNSITGSPSSGTSLARARDEAEMDGWESSTSSAPAGRRDGDGREVSGWGS